MAQSKYTFLIKLAEDKQAAAAERMRQAQAKVLDAMNRQEQLENFRNEYRERLTTGGMKGMSIAQWQDFQKFLGRLDEAVRIQQGDTEFAKQRFIMERQAWRNEHKKLKAYEKLLERELEREQLAQARREQKRRMNLPPVVSGIRPTATTEPGRPAAVRPAAGAPVPASPAPPCCHVRAGPAAGAQLQHGGSCGNCRLTRLSWPPKSHSSTRACAVRSGLLSGSRLSCSGRSMMRPSPLNWALSTATWPSAQLACLVDVRRQDDGLSQKQRRGLIHWLAVQLLRAAGLNQPALTHHSQLVGKGQASA
jgi:flagellar FliJ protein